MGANSFARRSSRRLILNALQLSYNGSMPYKDLRRGRHSVPNHAYHVTTVTAARLQYFAEFALARIVVGEMRRIHDSGDVKSLAWVLMPDHLHWLFYLGNNGGLSTVMKRLKAHSAHAVNRRTGHSGPIWEIGFHDHAVRAEEDLQAVARYIVANPLRAKLVTRLADYPHWDAAWL